MTRNASSRAYYSLYLCLFIINIQPGVDSYFSRANWRVDSTKCSSFQNGELILQIKHGTGKRGVEIKLGECASR